MKKSLGAGPSALRSEREYRRRAYLDAILAGAIEFDADDIAQVIARRPWP
jgi:hypothetical protein